MSKLDSVTEILGPDAQFDPTTPFGRWDDVAKQYENTTDVLIFNYNNMPVSYAERWAPGSPTPISGDTLARFRDMVSEKPKLKDHKYPGRAKLVS